MSDNRETNVFLVKLLKGNPLPKGSFKIHALLLYKVDDATHVPLQADGDVHKGCVVVKFGSGERASKRKSKCEKSGTKDTDRKPQLITTLFCGIVMT